MSPLGRIKLNLLSYSMLEQGIVGQYAVDLGTVQSLLVEYLSYMGYDG